MPTAGDRSAPRVSLHLLGGFRLLHDDVPVVVPRGLQRVIALIGLQPSATRSHLAGLLWPETSEERALSSLRTALWRLRQDPCCPLLTDGDTVRLGDTVHLDVDELVETAARVRAGELPPTAGATARHDLLPGWYDDWVLLERERLRQLRLHMLEELAGNHLAAGRHGEALEAALEAMAAEPLRETPHRLVVRIHLAEGNAFEAVHAFYVYRDLLLRELRLEPSAAMCALLADTLAPIRRATRREPPPRRTDRTGPPGAPAAQRGPNSPTGPGQR
ncbi:MULTISPECIES: BTAD domain-containing putative transcriptional regulator [Micromonospora]|uniref:Transcriptional regulator n=1 Tax=Micromonospora solifontis TaxID=2487138 RepID=A0ABX9W802_9ACTN|nr:MULTISPECIES: BTAD domain-containing putative transcriptional regulator [Micromonospora]NES13047.1 transcriptional regulator [Micromonospora sp. PPF5-17B]NES39825.1 transcriptional regulator [Micromonospora solifontis]NES54972.1 transcriptional regulator [Micromonospora sp. PPF5-6]RNL84668.1 transcriptional regulator [Micromonospora solifontis]